MQFRLLLSKLFVTRVRGQNNRKSGYVLPIMLIVALVGILFGFGRLAMFQNQVKLRLDRQRAIDRTLATRSALNYLASTEVTEETPYDYVSGAGRTYTVTIRPVEPIYRTNWPDEPWDYDDENGGSVKWSVSGDEGEGRVSLSAGTNSATDSVALWYDLPEGESWVNDLYGRRYWCYPDDIQDEDTVFSLYLFGNRFNTRENPDDIGDPWLRLIQDNSDISYNNVILQYWAGSAETSPTNIVSINKTELSEGFGVQLSGKQATLFDWAADEKYDFQSETRSLPGGAVAYFENIRLYFESKPVPDHNAPKINTLRHISVDPAYEYEIEIQWMANGLYTNEVSTYVHARNIDRSNWSIFTYDTHGTEVR